VLHFYRTPTASKLTHGANQHTSWASNCAQISYETRNSPRTT